MALNFYSVTNEIFTAKVKRVKSTFSLWRASLKRKRGSHGIIDAQCFISTLHSTRTGKLKLEKERKVKVKKNLLKSRLRKQSWLV